MHCAGCATRRSKKALEQLPGVRSAAVNLTLETRAGGTCRRSGPDLPAMAAAWQRLGPAAPAAARGDAAADDRRRLGDPPAAA